MFRYELWNGYKPAPVDQSRVVLTAAQEELVDKLAENEHNIWARDLIRQGWSYGPQQVQINNTPCYFITELDLVDHYLR